MTDHSERGSMDAQTARRVDEERMDAVMAGDEEVEVVGSPGRVLRRCREAGGWS